MKDTGTCRSYPFSKIREGSSGTDVTIGLPVVTTIALTRVELVHKRILFHGEGQTVLRWFLRRVERRCCRGVRGSVVEM